jgi:hypothetical protein
VPYQKQRRKAREIIDLRIFFSFTAEKIRMKKSNRIGQLIPQRLEDNRKMEYINDRFLQITFQFQKFTRTHYYRPCSGYYKIITRKK